ncbi:MAG: DNA polymerase III subunit delta [Pseudomonadota bacterium]
MKLAAKDAAKAFSALSNTNHIVVAYGEDAGGVSDILDQAERAICADDAARQNGRVLLRAEDISGDTARLADEAAQPGFFGDLKILRVGPVTDTLLPALKAVSESPRSAFVLVEAGALSPRSNLRQYFEKAKNAHIVPCYRDDARGVDRLIDDVLTSNGVQLSRDARQYLQTTLGADRAMSRSELEKIKLFAGLSPKEPLDFDTVTALVGDSSERSASDLAAAAFSGQAAQAEAQLSAAFTQGIHGIEITRALSRRAIRLLTARVLLDDGESVDGAMKALRPPVFWKEKAAFQSQLQAWKRPGLERCIAILNETELSLKGSGPPQSAVLGRAILAIAGQLKRSRRAQS